MPSFPLGRRQPTDWRHVERYPLTAATAPPAPTPAVLGIDWYPEFDAPVWDGRARAWYVKQPRPGSRPRGGHCVCLKPRGSTDPAGWWDFYNQQQEGACVGEGVSRLASHLNRKRYDAFWLYHTAQQGDEYPDTPPAEGTSVRAGLEVLRTLGHRVVRNGQSGVADVREGILEYRWATSLEQLKAAVGYSDVPFVDFLNSWGRSYPHVVRMPEEVADRVIFRQQGEAGLVTDRP